MKAKKPAKRITRKEFVKKAAVGAAAVALGMSGVAKAAFPYEGTGNPDPSNVVSDGSGGWIVYPTGGDAVVGTNPLSSNAPMTQDATNIQWAVMNVDNSVVPRPTVLLKARTKDGSQPMYFNFLYDSGPLNDPSARTSRVRIYKDVIISGERMPGKFTGQFPHGGTPDADFVPDRSIVYGGFVPFNSNSTPPVPLIAPNIAVRNIYFAYPCNCAVRVKLVSGFEVSDCVVYDVHGGDSTSKVSGYPFRLAFGLEVTGLNVATPFMKPNPYLYGDCRIINNRLKRRTEEDPHYYGFVDAGFVTQYTDMAILMSGNEVHNFAYVGLAMDANTGTSVISKNKVFNCGYGGYLYPTTEMLPNPSGAIAIRRNQSPVSIESNEVVCGYDYGGHRKTQSAIMLAGVSGTTIRENKISGILDGGEAGASRGINLMQYSGYSATGNSILQNDLKGLLAELSQVFLDVYSDGNELKNNDYGATGGVFEGEIIGGLAGAYVRKSIGNVFVNETFWGPYPGAVQTNPPQLPAPTPCLWFAAGSKGNTVTALKKGQALQGFDICTQVYFSIGSEDNTVRGYDKCSAANKDVVIAMMAREHAFVEREKKRCADSGGSWDEITQTCKVPAEDAK